MAFSGAMTIVTPPGDKAAGSRNNNDFPEPVGITTSTRSRRARIGWRAFVCWVRNLASGLRSSFRKVSSGLALASAD